MAGASTENPTATGASNEVRMILLGRTGTGRSSVGNTILGENKFRTGCSAVSITTKCACASRVFGDKLLFIVDTPGFSHSDLSSAELKREIAGSYIMTAVPGPHAFLLVIQLGRFTAEEAKAIDFLSKIFGPKSVNHTIIIFTHADGVDDSTAAIEQYRKSLRGDSQLQQLIDQCEQRYLAVNNHMSGEEKHATTKALLEIVTAMVAHNRCQQYKPFISTRFLSRSTTAVTPAMAIATGAPNELRLILLGRTGTGKSTFGNTILNETKFETGFDPNPITTKCTPGSRDFDRKTVFVVDTPGFLDPNVAEKEIQEEVAKSYEMTAVPGPHAFLLVMEPTRMTDQEMKAIEYLTLIFGTEAINHTIIIFTHGDEFKNRNITLKEYLKKLKPENPLKKLIDQCSQRFLLVDNMGTDEEKKETIKALINMITEMVASGEGDGVYSTDVYDAVAKAIAIEKSKGTFVPFKSDGSYSLLSKTKEIVIDGYLRRTIAKRAAMQ